MLTLAVFEAMAEAIEARFGPPSERGLDSNGLGPIDVQDLRFPCGLQVGLSRYHLGAELRTIDPATEPSRYEVHANDPDLAHVAFHLGVPVEAMSAWTPIRPAPPRTVIIMRTDDNGNDVEVTRVTSRCEATAVIAAYEARAHKQMYWTSDPVDQREQEQPDHADADDDRRRAQHDR